MQNGRLNMFKLLKKQHKSKFSKLKQEFDKINNAAAEQKSKTDASNLIDDILDEDNPFNKLDTEEMWIEDGLFDNDDTQAIQNVSKEILDVTDPIEKTILPNKNDKFDPIETIKIEDNIDVPSDDGIAIDAPKKVKIITDPNRLCPASSTIKRKYLHRKSKGILRKANVKAADWLKKAGYLVTDDLERIDSNNDTNINDLDDVEKVNYNNNTNVNDLDNLNLKKTSGAQIGAKKIVRKYRNMARRKPQQNTFEDLADLEMIDYNNNRSISDLNYIPSAAAPSKKTSSAKIAAKKL